MKLDYYQKIVKKTVDENIPFTVHFDLTYKCNLKCVHCYVTQEKGRKELSTEEIKSILDQLAKANTLCLTFSGGEIFTREDFFEIASYARGKDFVLRLLTNGTLITPKIADKIEDLNPISVRMSLYATVPAIHDTITRSKGSQRKTIKALILLKERGIKVAINSILMKENVGEFERLKAFAQEIGAGFVFDPGITPCNDGSKKPLAHRLTENDLIDFFSSNSRTSKWEPIEIPDDSPLCGAGLNTIYISPYGETYPCVSIRESCGNLTRQSLSEVWQAPILKRLRATKFSDLKECSTCPLRFYCFRCSGLALLEDGDLFGPSRAACTLARARKTTYENARISTDEKNR